MPSLRRCEIVSQLRNNDTQLFDMDKLDDVLSKKCISVYSYIIHDKDTYTESEEEKNALHKAGTLKPAHIHLLLRFDKPQNSKYIAKWFNLSENFVNKINGDWEDACLYQIHYNAPDKYQYEISEVTSSFDFEALIDETEDEDKNKDKVKKVLEQILSGEIREYNKTILIDKMMLVQNSRQINEAFKVYSEDLLATVKERNMQVIFITGKSGCGKSTLAKKIAKEKGLDYFVSSGSNDIMDGFAQQPCIILDDIRPSVLGLSDFLKMLENITVSSVKSRYKNKVLYCDLLILTTVLDINTFYNNVFDNETEPIVQLKRRCKTYIQMDRESIYISCWDDKTMRYTNPVAYKNNIIDDYIPEKSLTKEDARNQIADLLPFLELEENEVIDTGTFHLEKINHKKL